MSALLGFAAVAAGAYILAFGAESVRERVADPGSTDPAEQRLLDRLADAYTARAEAADRLLAMLARHDWTTPPSWTEPAMIDLARSYCEATGAIFDEDTYVTQATNFQASPSALGLSGTGCIHTRESCEAYASTRPDKVIAWDPHSSTCMDDTAAARFCNATSAASFCQALGPDDRALHCPDGLAFGSPDALPMGGHWDRQARFCQVDPDHCTARGLDFQTNEYTGKTTCVLPTWQALCENFVGGTTSCRNLKRRVQLAMDGDLAQIALLAHPAGLVYAAYGPVTADDAGTFVDTVAAIGSGENATAFGDHGRPST